MMLGKAFVDRALAMIPAALKATLFVRGLGLAKVPLLFLCQPVVEEIGDERCVVRIPLNFVTKNHLRSMYIGVLAIGADVTGGIMAVEQVRRAGRPVDVLFKDLKAEFLKRPTAAVRFTCADGQAIRAAVAVGIETGKRQNVPLHVSATVGDQEVARFDMTLTLKRRD